MLSNRGEKNVAFAFGVLIIVCVVIFFAGVEGLQAR